MYYIPIFLCALIIGLLMNNMTHAVISAVLVAVVFLVGRQQGMQR